MAGNKSYSIVEYLGGDDGYRCGYCKNPTGNFSHGKCEMKWQIERLWLVLTTKLTGYLLE